MWFRSILRIPSGRSRKSCDSSRPSKPSQRKKPSLPLAHSPSACWPSLQLPHRTSAAPDATASLLGLVAARLSPFGQGGRVAKLGALVVPRHHDQLSRVEPGRGFPHPRRGDRKQQVADLWRHVTALVRTSELAHDPEPAGGGHC